MDYRPCPGENGLPFAQPDAAVIRRAGFLTRNHPNRNPGGDDLPRWTKADRAIEARELVVRYTFGQTHIPWLEDWSVMPVSSVGFLLRSDGFFDQNPAMGLPPPSPR